ncbi:MAG: AAA family ATPase, partial [Candidatus Thermoplasmatota archaeon]|nr:AAA family ATPase [Candidatus Thermoplasmatota archaeon]
MSETGAGEDWTEKYRPSTIREMEGNSPQIRSIRQWLESWTGNGLPKKRGILLSGPPGVGKTTIAKAVASERGWAIIELNASEERNAASIRSAATRGSQHISLDLFSGGSVPNGKTIILLDEVDHLAGGFSKISEERIGKSLSPDDDAASISGDSGGKAELMNLLEISKQPVIMTCNDPMRLWGGGRSWRMNRDRILRVADMVQFKRVNPNDMRKIAYRILDGEGVKIDPGALEEIISGNPGDLRALVRDIQAASTLAEGFITVDEVRGLSSVAIRDSQIDVFRAMKEIYASRSGAEASEILRNSDKDPDQMLAWFSWNNLSVFDSRGLSTISEAMELAD